MIYKQLKSSILRVLIGLFLFSIFIFPASSAAGPGIQDKQEILVIGTSRISGGNVASARKSAISDALIKGMEEYLIRRLGGQGMVNNFSRVIHDIIPAAKEEMENFHILAEEQTDQHYMILVRVKVNEETMEERLREMGLVLMKGPTVRVLFMVSEEDMQEGRVSYWWGDPDSDTGLTTTELALHQVFQERGFSPVNRVSNVPEDGYSPQMTNMDLPDEDILAWGRLFASDVVISGTCEIIEGEAVFVTLKSYDTEKGRLIFMDTQTMMIDESSGIPDQVIESIESVINRISIQLVPETIKSIEVDETGTNSMEIELRGLKSFEEFRRFKDFLINDARGVNSVIQTRIRGNTITVQVEFIGKTDSFLERIRSHERFPFLAEVSKTEGGAIIVDIK